MAALSQGRRCPPVPEEKSSEFFRESGCEAKVSSLLTCSRSSTTQAGDSSKCTPVETTEQPALAEKTYAKSTAAEWQASGETSAVNALLDQHDR
jgi:hypothetical protein